MIEVINQESYNLNSNDSNELKKKTKSNKKK